ncbi:MAG: DUF885 domain-containing protein [Povalibacter sp.]
MHPWLRSVVLVIAGLVSCSAGAQSEDAEHALSAAIADYETLLRQIDPITAGFEGDREALTRMPDVSPEAEARSKHQLETLAVRLKMIEPSQLSPESSLNHLLLTRTIALAIEESGYDLARMPFENDEGFHTLAAYLGRTTSIASQEDAQAWLARLRAVPQFYRQNLANLRRGIRTKFTQPRIVVERVLDVARQQVTIEPEDSALLLPFTKLPSSIPTDLQQDYRRQAVAIIREQILPQQKAFVDLLANEYVSAARAALAWRSTPNGEATYRYFVRRETTTSMTPDEIHQLGLHEVQRIRDLMQKTIDESGFKGSFADFQRMLRTDSRFYAHTSQELLEKASEIAKRADGGLPPLFGTLPRLTYDVRPVPAEMAEGYTTGRYWGGSMKLGQPGGYMVNTSRLDQRPLYELPALTLHEAVPGHHLQIALSQELDGLPYFRRNLSPTAFIEGWGLYAEFLGEEMGMYRDPYEKFGRYSYEMWRACRLVADTGIHWLGWDLEEARKCFTDNSALAPHNIQTELERYVSWPAQALAYKIGELKLRGLRTRAQQSLGSKFNVRDFHDVVLQGGALPLDVLETRVGEWIEKNHHP